MFSWDALPKPIYALAPMHEVTDTAFRQLLARIAKPSVMFSEFVSVDGLCHAEAHDRIIRYYLRFDAIERPLIAQIWGSDPEKFHTAAQMMAALGFDGIDINMGCPDRKVIASGGGIGLCRDAVRAREIIAATQAGARGLPVSVKTRLGFDAIDDAWVNTLIDAKPAALTLHARTKKELSRVPAHWDALTRFVLPAHQKGVILLGNGDVQSMRDGANKIMATGVDGIMVGRGVLGNPWFFDATKDAATVSLAEKLETLLLHAKLFDAYFNGIKTFSMIKKHVHGYVSGFDGAGQLRAAIMATTSVDELTTCIQAYLHTL